jgi:hypothetical protein
MLRFLFILSGRLPLEKECTVSRVATQVVERAVQACLQTASTTVDSVRLPVPVSSASQLIRFAFSSAVGVFLPPVLPPLLFLFKS